MAATETSPSNPQALSRSVLIVDDDPIQRRNIRDFLALRGIAAETEDNGFSAVSRVKKTRPAIVLLDIRMPGLNGVEAARHISRVTPRPKIILMSGYPEAVYDANASDLDVFAVIQKPVPLRVLASFVERALGAEAALHEPS